MSALRRSPVEVIRDFVPGETKETRTSAAYELIAALIDQGYMITALDATDEEAELCAVHDHNMAWDLFLYATGGEALRAVDKADDHIRIPARLAEDIRNFLYMDGRISLAGELGKILDA